MRLPSMGMRSAADFEKRLQSYAADSEKNSGVASFLSDRLNSAAWLIRSIEQRRDTLYRIASEVADFQRIFEKKAGVI